MRLRQGAEAAHRFHRWAHHPGCGAYASEVLAVGRYRFCRGCALTLGGLGLGSALGGGSAWMLVLAAALVLVALKVRVSKVLGRLAPAVLMGMVAGQGLALLAAAASMSAGLWLLWSRRGPDRSACVACPQRTLAVCDGLRAQVRRERALHRWAGALTAKDFAARLS